MDQETHKILLVDDDMAFCNFVVNVVKNESVTLSVAPSLKEAKALIEKDSFDAFMIDNGLPDGEGLDLISWLRRREECKDTPLVLVTAHKIESEVFQKLCLELKIGSVLEKPIQIPEIITLIQSLTKPVEKKEVSPPLIPQEEVPAEEDDFLADLRAQYEASIPEKIAKIEGLISAVRDNYSAETVDALKKELHKIAGSAGSYGHNEVSRHCKKIENQLEEDLKELEKFRGDEEWINNLWLFFNNLKIDFSKPPPAHEVKKREARSPVDQGQIDLFVIDDDNDLTAIIQATGREKGYRIESVSSLDKGLEKIKNPDFKPRIILVDKHFDGEPRTGYDFIEAYRAMHEHEYASILGMLTGEGRIDQRIHALSLGVELFFQKPIEMDDLFDHIEEIIGTQTVDETRVTHFDDDPEFCAFVKQTLNNINVGVTSYHDGSDFFKKVDESNPDLILLDIEMPKFTGLMLLESIRADFRYRGIPIMLVTSREDQESMAKGFSLGIEDYIQKPVTQEMLQVRLMNYLKKKTQQAGHIDRDPITGLYNNRAMIDLFHTITAQEHHLCITLIEFYMEEAIPESLIKAIARFFEKHFRSKDIIGKLKGNQFIILFPGFRTTQMHFLLTRFFDGMRDIESVKNYSGLIACAGVVSYPENGEVFRDLQQRATNELLKAKEIGPWKISCSEVDEDYALNKTKHKKVLIVDDDEDIIKMIKYAFEMRGFEVIAMKEGEPTIDWIKEHILKDPPDLVVLDCNLPDISGLIILDRIKEMVGDAVPVLMLSSLSQEENILEALQKGAQEYITKPFSMSILLEKTLQLLSA